MLGRVTSSTLPLPGNAAGTSVLRECRATCTSSTSTHLHCTPGGCAKNLQLELTHCPHRERTSSQELSSYQVLQAPLFYSYSSTGTASISNTKMKKQTHNQTKSIKLYPSLIYILHSSARLFVLQQSEAQSYMFSRHLKPLL